MYEIPEGKFDFSWANHTNLHPIGLVAVLVLGVAVLALPRRHAVAPMVVLACFVSPAQRIVIFQLDFNLLRVIVLCGWARVLLRGELTCFWWKRIDTLVVIYGLVRALAYTILRNNVEAVVYSLGVLLDSLGIYFVSRVLIRDVEDVGRLARCFATLSFPVLFAFLVEHSTGRNLFAFLGGVPEFTVIREGRLRCQGAFAHPILAGCFWATVLPIIVARLWKPGASRVFVIASCVASVGIILLSASSTPFMSLCAGILGGVLFWFRNYMRSVRWGLLVLAICLHVAMKAPVWHLISRIDVVGGSTGWHRYYLIDQAIHRVGEWWLLGTTSTTHWGEGLFDITNQYILEGVRGGLLTLVLFCVILGTAFGCIGKMWRAEDREPWSVALAWSLGVSLFVHAMNFVAVSYFGQIILLWYMLLGSIGSLAPGGGGWSTRSQAELVGA